MMVIMTIGLDASNDDIKHMMDSMKEMRETKTATEIVVLIAGFDDDPREVYDIPEIRAFCRRLTCIGFISYLTACALADSLTKNALGAYEIWAIGEGKADKTFAELERYFRAALCASNAKADALCGEYKQRV